MNVTRVGVKSMCRGDKCRHCNKAAKIGDVVAWCRTDNFTKPRFVIHVDCMKVVADRAPESDSVAEVARIRERILETGDVWA